MNKAWVIFDPWLDKLPLIYEVEILETQPCVGETLDNYKGYTRIEILKVLWKSPVLTRFHSWGPGIRTHLSKEYIYYDKESAIKAHKEKLLAVKKLTQRQFEDSWDQLKAIAECDYSFMQDETYISPFDGEIK